MPGFWKTRETHKPMHTVARAKPARALSGAAELAPQVNKVDVEITPEPTEEERRAILEALAEEHPDALALSLWRRAALGPGPHDDADQAVAPPRHRRGATRA